MKAFIGARLSRPTKKKLLRPYFRLQHWLEVRQADVLIVSFPKSGRTWLRAMLGKAIAEQFHLTSVNVLDLSEMSDHSNAIPMIVLTHDGSQLPRRAARLLGSKRKYRQKKVVFLARDPRDIVVSSYFHATKREMTYRGPLTSFLQHSSGSFESVLNFYNSWARGRRSTADFMLVRYEDLHADPRHELSRILEFCGFENVNPQAVESGIEFASFRNLHKMESSGALSTNLTLRPADPSDKESYKTRKGKVGGFVDYLNNEEVVRLTERLRRELDPFYGYGNGDV